MKFPNLAVPYEKITRDEIVYSVCRDFNHISRYKGLRQVIHEGKNPDRYIALETVNTTTSKVDVRYYTVPHMYENRLDLISNDLLGSPTYSWVIAYINDITDGYSCYEGQTLAVPNSISELFDSGEILAAISAMKLNLSSE